MMAETFRWKQGLDKKFHQAKGFYGIMIAAMVIGLLLNFIGISPVQGLIYSAILYGITAPVIIVVVIHIGNNKKLMGANVNGHWSNILGWLTFGLMSIAAVALLYLQF
jgi:Mn2+/Fe2+ NRAMP family transporter